MRIHVILFALALAALVITSAHAAGPLMIEQTIIGKTNSRGELVTKDGKVYVVSNFKNLPEDSRGKEVRATGYISRGASHETIEVIRYYEINSPKWWENCVASCELHYSIGDFPLSLFHGLERVEG